MLKSNRVNVILAILMAIVLWAYVLGEIDPVRTVTIRDIPIKLLSESSLSDDGLVITEMDSTTTSVTFTAKRSVVNKIKGSDFHATASLKGVTQGDNIIDVEVSRPSNIAVESISHEHINVKTEKMITAEKTIDVDFFNQSSSDTEPKILRISEDTVNVTGATSKVNSVDRVVARVDASRITADPNSINAELSCVDSSGNAVEDVELEFKNVSVTVILKYLKSVDLLVPVTGKESGSISRGYSAPDKVMIKGSMEAIENVESITCESVDISDLYENKSVTLVPILPQGVELSDEVGNLAMEVAVYNAGVGEFNFDETNVNIVGVAETSYVKIHEVDISIKVKGMSAPVSSLTADDFTLTADATDLTMGTHTVELKVTTNKNGIDSIEVKPQKITIDVSTH